ncbi:MAG: hypothetical protein CFE24_07265 [Flavobacterium sp. BFFFF2]|nr:MAG: hypothetical protein CFE24_07265 [Flavobacterium sp. BFFFF2]
MDSSPPLYTLTVNEFSELIRNQFKSIQIPNNKNDTVYEIDNVDINWVSENLKIPIATIRTKVSRMEMPCKKRGKPMGFSKKQILEWNENGRPKVTQEIDFAQSRKKQKK